MSLLFKILPAFADYIIASGSSHLAELEANRFNSSDVWGYRWPARLALRGRIGPASGVEVVFDNPVDRA